jgi:hypothetical protein
MIHDRRGGAKKGSEAGVRLPRRRADTEEINWPQRCPTTATGSNSCNQRGDLQVAATTYGLSPFPRVCSAKPAREMANLK